VRPFLLRPRFFGIEKDPGYFADCVGCPVENVTWYRAIEFCNALSDSLGLEAAYRREGDLVIWNLEADGFRLPTEAEWECACRAGTTTRFHSGDCLTTDQANFNGYEPLGGCPTGLDRAQPLPVGSFPPNTWELFDMHGNVSEWCWDATGGYPSGPVIDPTGPGDGPQRCFRGGSWFSQDWHCRSAARFFVAPTNRYDFVGLRLARSLQLDRK